MKALRGKFTVQPNQGGFVLPHGAKIEKAGYLLKQSSSSLLQRERWKRRFCVLSDGKLYYYQNEPRTSAQKPSGIIFLEHFDVCREATVQERQKQKGFIFILQCTDKICLGKDKYMFCVDTDQEMSTWLYHLTSSTRRVQTRRKSHGSREQYQCHLPPVLPNNENAKRASEPSLYVATKYRAKGPKGRRLPTRKSAVADVKHAACRTASLSALHEEDNDAEEPMLRSSSSVELAYKYSSSNDDSDDEDRLCGRKPRCRSELDRPLSAVCPLLDDEGQEVVTFHDQETADTVISPLESDALPVDITNSTKSGRPTTYSGPGTKKATLNNLLSKMGEITDRLTGLQDVILDMEGQHSPPNSPSFKKKMADIKDKLSTISQVVIGLVVISIVFFGILLTDIVIRNFL